MECFCSWCILKLGSMTLLSRWYTEVKHSFVTNKCRLQGTPSHQVESHNIMATLPDDIKMGRDDGSSPELPSQLGEDVGSPTTPEQESREMPPPREQPSGPADDGYAATAGMHHGRACLLFGCRPHMTAGCWHAHRHLFCMHVSSCIPSHAVQHVLTERFLCTRSQVQSSTRSTGWDMQMAAAAQAQPLYGTGPGQIPINPLKPMVGSSSVWHCRWHETPLQ